MKRQLAAGVLGPAAVGFALIGALWAGCGGDDSSTSTMTGGTAGSSSHGGAAGHGGGTGGSSGSGGGTSGGAGAGGVATGGAGGGATGGASGGTGGSAAGTGGSAGAAGSKVDGGGGRGGAAGAGNGGAAGSNVSRDASIDAQASCASVAPPGCKGTCACSFCPTEALACWQDPECRPILECYDQQNCTSESCPACSSVITAHPAGVFKAIPAGMCYLQNCVPVCSGDAATD